MQKNMLIGHVILDSGSVSVVTAIILTILSSIRVIKLESKSQSAGLLEWLCDEMYNV